MHTIIAIVFYLFEKIKDMPKSNYTVIHSLDSDVSMTFRPFKPLLQRQAFIRFFAWSHFLATLH